MMKTNRVEFLKSHIQGLTLDVGATYATLHKELCGTGCRVIGLDILKPHEKTPMFVVADAHGLPFGPGSIDTVVAGESIEHMHTPKRFLDEAWRVLREEGRIIITTPNPKSYVNRIFGASFHSEHISLMEESLLSDRISSSGFRIDTLFYLPYTYEATPGVKPLFRRLFWMRRLLHYVMPRRLRENMVVLAKKI